MMRLSTNLTLFWRLFAIAWILYFLTSGIYWVYKFSTSSEQSFDAGKLMLFILFGFGSSIFVHLIGGTLKKVYLEGDALVISIFLKQIRIPFSDISHVDNPDKTSLRRIKIILYKPSEFGEEIVFSPPLFEAKEIAGLLKSRIKTNYQSL